MIPPVMSATVLVHLIAAQFDVCAQAYVSANQLADKMKKAGETWKVHEKVMEQMPISFELNNDEVSDGKRKVYI
jgi:hypothetical protein